MPAGNYALSFVDVFKRLGINVISVLDNFKTGKVPGMGGLSLIAPSDLKSLDYGSVFIATPSITVQEDMREQLVEIAPERACDIITLYDITSEHLDVHLLDMKEHIEGNLQKAGNRKTVCFITSFFHHNFLKLTRYIKKQGFHVTVITGHEFINSSLSIFSFEDRGFYDECLVLESYDVVMPKLLGMVTFDIVHAFVTTASSIPLKRAYEQSSSVFVTDYCDFHQILYDNESMYLKSMSPRQLTREKEAWKTLFTQSHGILIKDSHEIIQRLTEDYGRGPKSILTFHSYAAREFMPEKVQRHNTGLRIVFAGCVVNHPESHAFPVMKSLLDTAVSLNRQGIAFDIYNAMDTTGKGYEDYMDLSESLEHFTYHFAVPQNELASELAHYDLGWFVFDYSKAVESPLFIRTTFGSKIFNYLEAGLPVLVSRDTAHMADFVEHHRVGLGMNLEDVDSLGSRLTPELVGDLKKNVSIVTDTLSMEHQIHRLTHFYDSVREGELCC